MPLRIVFVCLGNTCRSPMAEGWARHLGCGQVEAGSAGLAPLGFLAPETVAVMAEKNVSLSGQRSKGLEAIDWSRVDLLVNMSPRPAAQVALQFSGPRLDWNIPDPYCGSLDDYRRTRDLLEQKVTELLAQKLTRSPGSGRQARLL